MRFLGLHCLCKMLSYFGSFLATQPPPLPQTSCKLNYLLLTVVWIIYLSLRLQCSCHFGKLFFRPNDPMQEEKDAGVKVENVWPAGWLDGVIGHYSCDEKRSSKARCRHSSVDSSAPSKLLPRVRVPGTPFTLLSFMVIYLSLYCEMNENKQKRCRVWPNFFKKSSSTAVVVSKLAGFESVNPRCSVYHCTSITHTKDLLF